MIDTVIVSGGRIQNEFALDFFRKRIEQGGREGLLLIAADKGLEFFMENQLVPDLVVGDFDSLSEKGQAFLQQHQRLEILRLKPEKDDSDTQSAVKLAVEKGAEDILILGGTGGRMDHTMANLGLLSLGEEMGVHIALADAWNYMTLIKSGTILHRDRQFGKYVSFFPLGGPVPGVVLQGFKYPLDGHYLTAADSGLTVSNEITEEDAMVTYERGSMLMIMSRDGESKGNAVLASREGLW